MNIYSVEIITDVYAIYLLIFTNIRELCPIFFCAAKTNCDEFIKLAINACMRGLPFYS